MLRRIDSEKILQSFNKKLVGCLLDEIILIHFGNCSFSGYDTIAFLQHELGISLSSSTVYGSLYSMERKGLLTGHNDGRKRIFKVTELGNLTSKMVTSKIEIDRLMTAILSHVRSFNNAPLSHGLTA